MTEDDPRNGGRLSAVDAPVAAASNEPPTGRAIRHTCPISHRLCADTTATFRTVAACIEPGRQENDIPCFTPCNTASLSNYSPLPGLFSVAMAERSATEIGVGVIGILNGLWNLLFGLVAFGLAGLASSIGASGTGAAAGIRGIFLLALGIGMLIAAGGLFSSQEWGWTAALGLWGVAALKSVYGMATGGAVGIVAIGVLVLNLAIVGIALSESDGIDIGGGGAPSTYGD